MSFFSGFKKKSAQSSPAARPLNATASLVGPATAMEDHGNTVFCCAFSHGFVEGFDSRTIDLATASYDGTTRVWDIAKCVANASKKCRRTLKANPGGVWCCAYTADSRYLVAGCSKGSICVYSARERYELVGRQDLSHGSNAVFACNAGSIGGVNVLATGGGDNNLKLWETSPNDSGELNKSVAWRSWIRVSLHVVVLKYKSSRSCQAARLR